MQAIGIKFSKTPKILIVEDDIFQRKLMVKFIQDTMPCEIVETSDGLDALTVLFHESENPDLILLDLILPCLNGVEFLSVVRGRHEFDQIPVIVCTSVAETSEIRGTMRDWIDSYLVKPIDRSRLAEKLLKALHSMTVRVDYERAK